MYVQAGCKVGTVMRNLALVITSTLVATGKAGEYGWVCVPPVGLFFPSFAIGAHFVPLAQFGLAVQQLAEVAACAQLMPRPEFVLVTQALECSLEQAINAPLLSTDNPAPE